jgi:hypothetical protein
MKNQKKNSHFEIYLDNFHRPESSGTMHTCNVKLHDNVIFLFLNIRKMRGHCDQIVQHATCPTKHKCKFKNQKLTYQ